MRRDAGAEIEGYMIEMIARARGTIRPAFLEAGDVRIAVVPAARTLREVAAQRRQMTDLRRREALRRRSQAGIGRGNARIGGDGGDGRKGADTQVPVVAPMHADRVGHG